MTAAIRLTTSFATAYGTYSYDQPPQAYLARLRPMATPELYGSLARAASTRSIQAQRARDREAATAHATANKIRTIGPHSLILIINLRQDITTTAGRHQRTQRLAITATKTSDDSWAIHDFQPADAGNAGDTSAGAS
ncbi:hypothetical protein [Actinomadura miaoliensis]|uniref:hypothetical protein n=1 Tax=Actinomadura miaoliensis TaxID=430685 RepID=UPI0031E60583